MKLSHVKDIAEKYGMEFSSYQFLDGYLTNVAFRNKQTKEEALDVEAEFDPEYEEELEQLEPGKEYEIDFTRCTVKNICIYGPVVNESGFFDGSTNGIVLYSDTKEDSYTYRHSIKLLETCIQIQQNPITHSRFILEKHLHNLDVVKERFWPVLEELGFHEMLSDLFNLQEEREDTHLTMWYEFDKLNQICLYTDCITGQIIYGTHDITNATTEEFRELVYNDVVYRDTGSIKLEFEFILHKGEKGWNQTTAQQIYQIDDDLRRGFRYENDVNYDYVPDKYATIVEKHKQLSVNPKNPF